jgi:hypothetical protein
MTVTITNHRGQRLTGEVRCWMGRRVVEVETSDGSRHIGLLHTEAKARATGTSPEPAREEPR